MTNIPAASNGTTDKPLKASPASSNPAGVLKRTNAYFIDPRTVMRQPGWNPRFDFGEINGLRASIMSNGVLNPIRVKRIAPVVLNDGKGPTGAQVFQFVLLDGDRRLTAVEIDVDAFMDKFPEGIPAIIVDKSQEDVTSLLQMFEANSGKTFLPLEEAGAYQRLRDAGMTLKAICASVGRKHVHDSEMLSLLNADDSLKQAVASGEVGKTVAKQIAKNAKGDKATTEALVAAAKDVGKSTTKRSALLRSLDQAKVKKAKAKGKVVKIRALDNNELSALGTSVAGKLADHMKAGKFELDADLPLWLKQQRAEGYRVAFLFGALEALKAAAGAKNELNAAD